VPKVISVTDHLTSSIVLVQRQSSEAMAASPMRALLAALLLAGRASALSAVEGKSALFAVEGKSALSAEEGKRKKASRSGHGGRDKLGGHHKLGGHYKLSGQSKLASRQTPEELGIVEDVVEAGDFTRSIFNESYCLDMGSKGFPLPVFKLMQESRWTPSRYFERLAAMGYVDDALQMTGPQVAIMQSNCMKERRQGRTRHIFVGDSQMMALRNALHRLNGCPEVWWYNATMNHQDMLEQIKAGKRVKTGNGRFHAQSDQTPDGFVSAGCKEDGIASFIFWDAWLDWEIPVQEIRREIEQLGVEPHGSDTVVVWVGSNFIASSARKSVLQNTVDKLYALGVKMVWDSPTFIDEVMMAATSTKDLGNDKVSGIPITYTAVGQRKIRGDIGSNQYRSEKAFMAAEFEVPMTKRWQLTNRYRGLQCDGIHSDMRARDPMYYDLPCPKGPDSYGKAQFCNWVEPFDGKVREACPEAVGLDDMVLQSGLYSMCAAHESPFCYAHTERIR